MTDAPDIEPAALAKWLENEAYDADSRALNFKGGTPQRKDWQIRAKRFRAAALSARSAPEAGKAVDFADGIPFDLVEKVENRIAYRISLGSTPRAIAEDVLQLASASPQLAGLVERLNGCAEAMDAAAKMAGVEQRHYRSDTIREAAAAITNQREHIRKQAEDIMTLGRLVYPKDGIGADDTWKARCAASEAEAADLRRKLEEHQDAEDKAAREMATVIQGLRNRATAAERKLEEARKALEEVRGHFRVEYPISVGGKPSIGYDSEALPKVIAILDRTLSGASE